MHQSRPAVALASVALSAAVSAQGLTDQMTAREFELAGGGVLPYRIYQPALAEGEESPLVLFLHGSGERGDDNTQQLRHGVKSFIEGQDARPCFVAAPQCPRGQWWDPEHVIEFAEAMIATAGVDRDRVYITGLSMGGVGTWQVTGRRPELFAAAIPVCGFGELERASRLTPMPLWVFHGSDDRVLPVKHSRAMVEAIRAAGGAPKYTEYAGVAHDSWTRTYANPDVHAWLFNQRRPAPVVLKDGDRVVFLGDSITYSGARKGGYIRLMEAELAARREGWEVELIGAGISGHKVPDLQARLDRDVLSQDPTIVIVYIGINDVWHWGNNNGTEKDDFDAGLRELADRVMAAGSQLILCTPTVIGERTDGANKFDPMLEDYSGVTRRVALAKGAHLLDLRAGFLEHLRKNNGDQAAKGVLTTDTVHLNSAGNRLVADLMLAAIGVAGDADER